MNVLITGANRGLGAGFARHYLAQGERVWGSYRNDSGELASINDNAFTPIRWDVTQPLAPAEQQKLPADIHLLINNAGVYGNIGGGQSLTQISEQEMLEVFRINAAAPINVVQTLLSQLRAGGTSANGALIANMSSKMGSVDDNTSGGVYAYRASKSALLNISRSMAHDLADEGVKVITLHPGWVRTDMTAQTGLIDVEESVGGLTSVIQRGFENTYPPGAFIAFDGQIVPY